MTGEINLPDDHPTIFERLIKFFYTGDFDATPSLEEVAADESSSGSDWKPSPSESSIGWVLKSNFDVKEAASETVNGDLGRLTICTRVFVMAEKYDIPALKTLAKTKFEAAVSSDWNTSALSDSLRLMYDGLPDSDRLLKDVAIEAAAGHVKELFDRGEFVALCKENGDIAFDVLKASLSPKVKNRPWSGVSRSDSDSY
ncbi:btb poz domain-containing protein [Rutstroemia sp. NJR-2017a BVV2]|nr:btb poz domain-containing protein [Rutstroemia sp. NJR-2017a BVV2]